MIITCPKCEYVRKDIESVPDYECPNCGIVYAKYEAIRKSKYSSKRPTSSKAGGTNKQSSRKASPQNEPSDENANRAPRTQANVGTLEIIVHLLLWLILSFLTIGIALFFLPYSFSKFIINRTLIIEADGSKRRMQCNTNIFGEIWHIILWIVITILTLGFGYLFYTYKVWNYSLNNTEIL